MPLFPHDDALSEVVGFVLLLAVIVVALSLYQVYGVPAAGREAEIAHMNQVKDRMITGGAVWTFGPPRLRI
jgi:hypothetical protein